MKERIQKLITKWRERTEWAQARMGIAIRTIDKAAYEAVWLESARIGDDLESLLAPLLSERSVCQICGEAQSSTRHYENWQPGSGVYWHVFIPCPPVPREQWVHPTWEPALPPPTPPPVKCIVVSDSSRDAPAKEEFCGCAARGCKLCIQWVKEFDAQAARFEALGGTEKAGMAYEEMRLKGYVSPINHPSARPKAPCKTCGCRR